VHSNINVIDVNRRQRSETLSYTLRVDRKKYQSIYKLHTYTSNQFKKLLSMAGCFEIINVYDLDYDLNYPLKLNPESEAVVFILKKA
jgi:hypothetical protein